MEPSARGCWKEQKAHAGCSTNGRVGQYCAKVAAVKTDPKANHLLLDYVAMTERFGFLDFGEFIALWHAADALMEAGLEAGFEPQDIPEMLLLVEE